jgi:hypothetical protein
LFFTVACATIGRSASALNFSADISVEHCIMARIGDWTIAKPVPSYKLRRMLIVGAI